MDALGHSLEHARRPVRARVRLRVPQSARRGCRDRHRGARRDQHAHPARAHRGRARPQRRLRHGRLRRRAIESVSACHGHRAQIAGRRRASRDRRLPRLGLPRHAAADAGRPEGGAGARRLALRRRGRGPARARAARRGDGRAAAALRFHEGSAPRSRRRRRPSCRSTGSSAPAGGSRASMPDAAARSNARSAPSSTCRGANRASARRTMSRRSCAPIWRKGVRAISSSPTTISRATRTGSRSSTGSSRFAPTRA